MDGDGDRGLKLKPSSRAKRQMWKDIVVVVVVLVLVVIIIVCSPRQRSLWLLAASLLAPNSLLRRVRRTTPESSRVESSLLFSLLSMAVHVHVLFSSVQFCSECVDTDSLEPSILPRPCGYPSVRGKGKWKMENGKLGGWLSVHRLLFVLADFVYGHGDKRGICVLVRGGLSGNRKPIGIGNRKCW